MTTTNVVDAEHAVGFQHLVYSSVATAGAQLEFSAEQDRGVAELWVRFAAEVAIGWG